MGPSRHPSKGTDSGPPTLRLGGVRPVRATAGRGGHAAQLEKAACAIEDARRPSERSEDPLRSEPINQMAPSPRRRRQKKTGKQKAKVSTTVQGSLITS